MPASKNIQTRRHWLKQTGCGLGGLALGALTAEEDDDYAPESHLKRPEEPKAGRHHVPRAKRVIFLYMPGGPSQIDTFDYKPRLGKTKSPNGRRGPMLPSPFEFNHHGSSGLPISELFANLGEHADDLCLLNAMETGSAAHHAAEYSLHSGSGNGRGSGLPSIGSWSYYGLGNGGGALPGYLTINYNGSAQNFGSGFLPSKFQGTRLEIGSRKRRFYGEPNGGTANVANRHYTGEGQRRQLNFVQSMNQGFAETLGGSEDVDAVIDTFEQGYDLQDTFNSMLDATSADTSTQALYGIDQDHSADFGQQCLVARRMAEQGVPFIQLNHGRGIMSWDHHNSMDKKLRQSTSEIDRPIAGLLTDLKQRGLFEDTLVVWGGEFGRTPHGNNGRDHQNRGFTMWMAGGGVKGGIRHGATDPSGGTIEHGAVGIQDLHATILHQLGFDPKRLAVKRGGQEMFSAAKDGAIVREVLS